MARPPNPELTHQQRRVLELMARGRTNAEIAEALGVTLDGAKYHVREVFDKLGVSSREEAVASWRAGMPSLSQRLRGWLWPVGAVLAGVGVAAIVVTAVVVNQSGDGAGIASGSSATTSATTAISTATQAAPALPANWQLLTAIVTPAGEPGTETTTLRVMGQGEHASIATSFSVQGHFGAVAWSPDGSALAVVSQGASGHIIVYRRANWSSYSFPIADTPAALRWSPDGKYIAGLGRGLAIYRSDGTRVAQYLPARTTGITSNGLVWSPGSAAVDSIINGQLRVLTVTGAVRSLAPPGSLRFTLAMAWAWVDDTTPVVIGTAGTPTSNPQPTRAYSIHLESLPPGWKQSAISATGIMRPLSDAVRAASAKAPQGTSNLAAVTADGAFGLVDLFVRSGDGAAYHSTLTAYDGEKPFATLDLGTTNGLPPDGSFSGVVTSGSG